ncbi:hypothetical protein DYBT9275_01614 [Dyadobacter sp. CECT 9275]|uniref:O-antigen ligase-related domain-containing protein n=1 Tax=Dyadobacter helix TaxID=2822344 RepID=A0A916JAX2_9BACT|nr:O-antigen ligase family protein [Dyadobacter sp. CECT 9275]CAG4995345.1 hypothetical protein DYBT9275_01614 [Dyadobacter sp. CECT 9275]
MIEIAFLLGLIIFSSLSKKENILYLIVFLLPFHTFIKSCFVYYEGGGNIFTVWKELVIIILCFKVYTNYHIKFSKNLSILLQIFLGVILVFYFFSNNHSDSLATLRDHLFPIILFVALSCCPLDVRVAKKTALIFAVSVIINCIMGFVQNFFLNIPISMLMGRIDFIDDSGYVQYKTTSARILGFERMSGIMGGPNTFGVFCSFTFVFFLGIFLNTKKFLFSFWERNLVLITAILSMVCLLFSFSRAGWVIAFLGALISLRLGAIKIHLRYLVVVGALTALSGFFLLEYFPQVGEVLYNSVTGKEASAADRSNNFNNALEINLTEPFGHGLGTTDHRYKSYEFFAESAFMNIAYEIGLLGLLLLILLHFAIFRKMYDYKGAEFRPFAKIAISVTLPTLLVCFVSINPYGMPYIYLWWLLLGLGINHFNHLSPMLKKRKRKVLKLV